MGCELLHQGLLIQVSRAFGYLVADNLELIGSIGFTTGTGELYEALGTTLGATIGVVASRKPHGPTPFIGASGGLSRTKRSQIPSLNTLILERLAGTLLPVATNVAVDVGSRVRYARTLDDSGVNVLSVPIGYLGLKAFF